MRTILAILAALAGAGARGTDSAPCAAARELRGPEHEAAALLDGRHHAGVIEIGARRAIAAPADATIGNVMVAPGARVALGQTLLTLDAPALGRALALAANAVDDARAAEAAAAAVAARVEDQIERRARRPELSSAEDRATLAHALDEARANQARAKAAQARAVLALDQARAEHAALRVVAPVAGRVGGSVPRVGESLARGATLLWLETGDEISVRFLVPEAAADALAAGTEVCVRANDSAGAAVAARVTAIADAPDAELRGRVPSAVLSDAPPWTRGRTVTVVPTR